MDTWGMIPKSQVDPETIEEAIARLIQVHKDDENAHIETGQSLETHKASEVIDHLAFSVVRDKISYDRFSIDSDFQSLDSWSITGSYSLYSINQFEPYFPGGVGTVTQALIYGADALDFQAGFDMSPNWQIRAYLYGGTNLDARFGMLNEDDDRGAGFQMKSSYLSAVWFDSSDVKHTEQLVALASNTSYVCRVEVDYVAGDIRFFVNGILEYTASATGGMLNHVFALLESNYVSGTASGLIYSNLHFDADYY